MDANNKIEQWEKSILDSLNGIERAMPDSDLYLKIKNNIYSAKNKTITMVKLRMSVVAAIILIILNVYFLNNYIKDNTNNTEVSEEIISQISLTSNYKLYE